MRRDMGTGGSEARNGRPRRQLRSLALVGLLVVSACGGSEPEPENVGNPTGIASNRAPLSAILRGGVKFAAASAEYGRRVAFLGADVNDDAADAHAFLAQHPVSYPSYQMRTEQLTGIVPQGVLGTPTTIFIDRVGKIVAVHTGQYEAQGTLDADIESNALRG